MRGLGILLGCALTVALGAEAAAQQGQGGGAGLRRLPPEVFDVTPPSDRVKGQPGSMTLQSLPCRSMKVEETRRRIVNVAVQEWAFFGFFTADATVVERRVLPAGIIPDTLNPELPAPRAARLYPRIGTYEDSDRVAASIAGYWAATPEGGPIVAAQNRAWQGPGGDDVTWQEPWSAAFISWVMCEGGLGTTANFNRSVAHRVYIDQAIKARDGAAPKAAYVAYDAGEMAVSPGDLLCNGQRQNYRTIADRRRNLGDGARTHCDVVVKVDEIGKRVYVIGGNSSRSVTMQILPGVREGGRQFRPIHGTELRGLRTTFAHLKHRAPPIEANALDNSPTIKQLRCLIPADGEDGARANARAGTQVC
jgi:hypothetical protein